MPPRSIFATERRDQSAALIHDLNLVGQGAAFSIITDVRGLAAVFAHLATFAFIDLESTEFT